MRRCVLVVIAFVLCVPVTGQAVNPDVLWKALLTGNLKYEAGEITYKDLQNERAALEKKQQPPVTVLSCSDSRVPPELVFNQSLGALFVVRTAGNIANDFELATIEYGISKGWTSLIVVLGHENCGAVGEALELSDPKTPSLLALVTRIRTSFIGIAWNGKGNTDVTTAVEANARASAAWLTANSTVVRNAVTEGKLKIIPAFYQLKSGHVRAIE